MQPVTLTLHVTAMLPRRVLITLLSEDACQRGAFCLSHDEYIGLVAALEVGASQSGGLFTVRHDNEKWLKWRRQQKSGYPDTPRPLKTSPRPARRQRGPSQRHP